MGPETPLTRILEIMTGRFPLYQFEEQGNKLQMDLKPLKSLKRERRQQTSALEAPLVSGRNCRQQALAGA
jgi:hypothetical protein